MLNFTSESCHISKIVDELVLELVPVIDLEERVSLLKGHGLEHDLGFVSVCTGGESEELYGRGLAQVLDVMVIFSFGICR